jgi:Domain of unknown function (DUF1818)
MGRILKTGPGWRIGWDPASKQYPKQYQGLIGNDDWAIELTQTELNDLRKLCAQLTDTIQFIATELMPDEAIELEAETALLWVGLEGYSHCYSLRFILLSDRGGEGAWSETATPPFLQALAGIEQW